MHASVQRSLDFGASVSRTITGSTVPDSRSALISLTSYDIALEHHRSIVTLVEHANVASALALMRPMFESCVTGLWATYVATASDIVQFDQGRGKRDILATLHRLRKKDDGEFISILEAQFLKYEAAMHSYTHGGVFQISRRIGPTHIGPQYDATEVDDLLHFADSTLVAVALEAADLLCNPEVQASVHEIIDRRFQRRA